MSVNKKSQSTIDELDNCLSQLENTVKDMIKGDRYFDSGEKRYLKAEEVADLFKAAIEISTESDIDDLVNGKYYIVSQNIYTFYLKSSTIVKIPGYFYGYSEQTNTVVEKLCILNKISPK